MIRTLLRVLTTVLLMQATASVSTQERPLAILSASPRGTVAQLADATEIRIVFSEPMIALGGPVTGAPAWLSIAPAFPANYMWSGTRTLIVTVDPASALPYATRFTVRVDGAAASAAGRVLGRPQTFTFTTPTVRLLSAAWHRRDGRVGQPVLMALRFNQPVEAADVAAHTRARFASHDWNAPELSGASRAWLRQHEPDGLDRFDRKVRETRGVAASIEPIGVELARTWDEARVPRSPEVVVLETTATPPAEAWLEIALDGAVPSPDGPETPGAPQSTIIRLEPAFFVETPRCSDACDPDAAPYVALRRGVELEALQKVLTAGELDGRGERRPVAATRPPGRPGYRPAQGHTSVDLRTLGFDPQPPVSTWVFKVDGSLEATDGQRLDYPWVSIVETLHRRPFAGWSGDVWEASGGPRVPFFARNVRDARISIAPLAPADLVSRVMTWGAPDTQATPSGPTMSQSLRVTPDAIEPHGIDVSRAVRASGTGAVWAAVRPTDVLANSASDRNVNAVRAALLQVTNLGVTVKHSPLSTLVLVTRLDNVAPVEGASVAVFNASSREVWRGTTNGEGVAVAPALSLLPGPRPWQPAYLVTAQADDDVAWVRSDWTGDVQPWRFGLSTAPSDAPEPVRGQIFTDRGVYIEGEELRLKAILRVDAPAGMRLLSDGDTVSIEVRDGQSRRVDARTLRLSRWSSVDWTWTVPAGASLGRYSVRLWRGTSPPLVANQQLVTGTFLVAAFRRPEFRVDASVAAEPAVLGTTIAGAVRARYLFGAPLGPQPVRWFLRRAIVHDVPRAVRERYPEQQFAFGYLPRQDTGLQWTTTVAEGRETLDAAGDLQARIETEQGADYAASFSFEGDVEGASGQHIANRASVVMHPASFYLGLARPSFFVGTGEPLLTAVVAANLDGTPRAGVPVTVSLWREAWTSRQPQRPGQSNGVREELPAGEWTVTTTADRVSMPVTIKEGGRYILRATARDERGRPTRTEVAFYALGGGRSLWRDEGNRIDLTPERRTWAPGETARILVQSPWERATALVTTEREGIRTHRRISITSTQDAIDVPITEADVPNVYVSVLLLKGRTADDPADDSDPGRPAFRLGYTELAVDDASKRLRVTVTADRQEYRPRQDARVEVAVSDADGRARAGEVTLWAVDYGLLSLTDYRTPDVARAIYARKPLQVQTQDNRLRLIGRRALGEESRVLPPVAQGAAGRGGIGQAAAGPPPPPAPMAAGLVSTTAGVAAGQSLDAGLRTDFRPLVFWLGSVETSSDGRASTTVTLPDSLTTYRIMAVAGDMSSRFGAGDAEIRASKPLTLLPAFPRFLSRGDRASFGAVVTNGTGAAGDATVTVRSLEGGALAFAGASTQIVRLAPGESRPVRFDAVARSPGQARIRITVRLGGETDAFELPLPVIAPARLETTAAYGETTSSAIETLAIPAGVVPVAGGLTVTLASTALVGLGESARYLDEYPYECAEQVASRALALLLTADLGDAFALPGATPEASRAAGAAALARLARYQCGNGGFALWPGECRTASPYLTAYILDVMRVAQSLPVETDRAAVDRALAYLQRELRRPPPELQWWPAWSATQAYAVKVLAEGGRNPSAEISRLYGAADRMPIFALSYLADALRATRDSGARYQDVLRRLTNAIWTDADRAHVQEVDEASLVWLWHSNVRATAVVLGGLARRQDSGTFAAPMARWLLAARVNGRWGTTQDNAVGLEALVNYYRAFESETPQMTATAALGGAPLGTATFAGRSTAAHELRVPMRTLLQETGAAVRRDLSISRTGTGRLYYTARLQYLPVEAPPPVDRGLRVERRYQRWTNEAVAEPAMAFAMGDLVRVTLTVTLPHEGRFLAISDPLPAGFEPIDATLKTTAVDLGEQASAPSAGGDGFAWWRRGGFDRIEKHDDRVVGFATRLAAGRHELTYLVRATTPGTFHAAGAWGEAMYAPEVTGRAASAVVTVK